MKYIRTKDGRILKGGNYGFGVSMPYKNYDVKIADTIKELCDVFICQQKVFRSLKDVEAYLRSANEWCNFNIYGAIWVEGEHGEPILKSVAKLNNEKGELELL